MRISVGYVRQTVYTKRYLSPRLAQIINDAPNRDIELFDEHFTS